MKKIKISDCLDSIDPAQLDNIEKRGKMKKRISTDNIKKIAYNTIDVQGALSDTYEKAKPTRKMKLAAILVAAIVALSTAVYALGSLGVFGIFFPESSKVIEGKTQDIVAQTHNNGITFTIDKAVNDGKMTVITYTLTKDDGSAFKEGIKLGSLILYKGDTVDQYLMSVGDPILTEDNKKAIGYFYLGTPNITANNLDFKLMDIETQVKGEKAYEGPWSLSIKLEPSDIIVKRDVGVKIPAGKMNLVITKISASELGVYIEKHLENKDGTRAEAPSSIKYFINDAYLILTSREKQKIDISDGYYFQYLNDNSAATFVDPKDISVVVINGVEIPMK